MASSAAKSSSSATAASASTIAASGGVVPAQLGFLTIFNPSLGSTDETIDDQIVYYASVSAQPAPHKRRRSRGRPTDALSLEERHERLRQIGLAQGMVNFGRGFADGAALDAIDTERTRVVMHELEPGWWILASIDLTKVPLPPRLPTKPGQAHEDKYEYSTKEMKPASLLLRDLLRAHSIFLMHHDSSLSALFVHTRRSKFVGLLSRYWDLFLSTWNVMLHGNPARDIYGGINVAASGELGVGVGEEERGSGEREVLEGLVGRIEGLVDLVVSKFGTEESTSEPSHERIPCSQWLGTGREPAADDGAIFLGTGALSRKSVRDVTHWMEDLYTWGEHAYGIIESPTSIRRANARKSAKSGVSNQVAIGADAAKSTAVTEPSGGQSAAETKTVEQGDAEQAEVGQGRAKDAEDGKLDKMISYMKLGYGSYWTFPGSSGDSSPAHRLASTEAAQEDSKAKHPEAPASPIVTTPGLASQIETAGHFLIGLRGNIEESQDVDSGLSPVSSDVESEHNSRTLLRTLHVEVESDGADGQPEATVIKDFEHPASVHTRSQVMGNMIPGYNSHDLNKAQKLRVVVYVNRPFIFTFLFRLRTDSLAWDTLYRSLHHQLAPLKKSLAASTMYRPDRPESATSTLSSIYDLVWDPMSLTVHCTIPCIPEQANSESWSRADAVNTHLHLLNAHDAGRSLAAALERTHKTNRGWWIVWARVPSRRDRHAADNERRGRDEDAASVGSGTDFSQVAGYDGEKIDPRATSKEIFLLRRASDHAGLRSSAAGVGGGDGAGKLAQGIGVDTRRYVEELLSLL
ncbi:hypothetical protein HIM_07377 [Hirsutella minnesotensis 3608]|uniref:CCZ1/INTU/HSP4 first Longin domain-containing protein n=1 Tax=Hirsutella minnesotensis 3608 TaxID=1043627 RepID=A0A0F7ZN59_9HYPO|nr:hypothetical protein HIM_07377 [Hirsutella minnesotensis 3608]